MITTENRSYFSIYRGALQKSKTSRSGNNILNASCGRPDGQQTEAGTWQVYTKIQDWVTSDSISVKKKARPTKRDSPFQ